MADNICFDPNELAQLEADILNKAPNKEEDDGDDKKTPPKAQAVINDRIPPKSTKAMLIEDCKRICKELGKEIPTARWFKKQKKAQVEEYLKQLVAEMANKMTAGKLQEKTREEMLKNPSESIECKALFNANSILCSVLEKTSVALKDKTFGIPLLEGWAEEINESKEQLMVVYAQILDKYGSQVAVYVDPLAQLGIIMMTSAASCAAKNIKKKKEQVKKKINNYCDLLTVGGIILGVLTILNLVLLFYQF